LIFLTGVGSGLALIVALGAQNVFVLRQGIRRAHVGAVVAVCALSDAVLIMLGTLGVGAVVEDHPDALQIARIGGACFLLAYGLMAARRVWRPSGPEPGAKIPTSSWRVAVLTCVAFTWLNPHVYLDTVVLLGSIANTHGPSGRWIFAVGAVCASVAWFSALGYGARFMSRVFERPQAWRVLDGLVAVVMVTLALSLVAGA
ncbi:MAG: amino acid transporter, partial [Nocardioidaceae bacterium]|nr:amino acid transporter [Nocardioidaceae bacterium]